MTQTVEAVFDGAVLRPESPLELVANTRVRLTVEPLPSVDDRPAVSFLATARSLQLKGPSDWSENLDQYLTGSAMNKQRWMPPEVFLDTAFAIALSNSDDEHHERAVELSVELQADHTTMVTTQAVLLEVGNSLSRRRYRSAGITLADVLLTDPPVEVVTLSDDLFTDALALYRGRPDKDWGLTDCVSFVLMERLGLQEALTTDRRFEQAGFRALMRA